MILDLLRESDRNPEVVSPIVVAAGPQQACMWQATLSRRNVNPHLQISFDSCELKEGRGGGGGGGGEAAIFNFHSAKGPKPEIETEEDRPPSFFQIRPEGDHPA